MMTDDYDYDAYDEDNWTASPNNYSHISAIEAMLK